MKVALQLLAMGSSFSFQSKHTRTDACLHIHTRAQARIHTQARTHTHQVVRRRKCLDDDVGLFHTAVLARRFYPTRVTCRWIAQARARTYGGATC
jgi:hypothetical protein